jgi:hypothetical protein
MTMPSGTGALLAVYAVGVCGNISSKS